MTAEKAAAEYASRAVNSPTSPWSVDGLAAAFLAGAAWEREECAKLADAEVRSWNEYSSAVRAAKDIAAAIRSRGAEPEAGT